MRVKRSSSASGPIKYLKILRGPQTNVLWKILFLNNKLSVSYFQQVH
jgi:hypothetical protein